MKRMLRFRFLTVAACFVTSSFFIHTPVFSQGHEAGISVVLSGHLLIGPYYRYRIDDHNGLDVSVQAAVEDQWQFIFPNTFSAGYRYYAFEKHWRPSVGVQYSLMISPKEEGKRYYLQLFSLVPGVQFRFADYKMGIEETLWLSHLKFPDKKNKQLVMPLGFDTRFGYSFK